jgi:surface polysaccharide O-acyltransferase-like enzyme
VLISGYYGIRLKSATVIKLLLQAWFFSIAIGLSFLIIGKAHWNNDLFFSMLLPISSNDWWFITNYLFLVLLSPLLNHLVHGLDKKPLTILLIVFIPLEYGLGFYYMLPTIWGLSGYALFNFIGIYLIGGWLKRFYSIWPRWVYGVILLLSTLGIFGVAGYDLHIQRPDMVFPHAYSYNSPLVVISAMAAFFLFKSFQLKARWIFTLSPLILGIYLLHDHPLVRGILYNQLFHIQPYANSWNFFWLWPIWLSSIFAVGAAIEWLRAKIVAPLETWLVKRPFFVALDGALQNLTLKK